MENDKLKVLMPLMGPPFNHHKRWLLLIRNNKSMGVLLIVYGLRFIARAPRKPFTIYAGSIGALT
jgi:hypothetical protein